ncbi:MAG: hypothetical protein IKX78_03020 [Clostridia bacterium]|nr:hypothetical protein [Clostridia bacterium]
MKRYKFLKICAGIVLSALIIIPLAFSAVSYSAENDPLVTLSYLTDIILPQMKQDVSAEIDKKIAASADIINSVTSPDKSQSGSDENNDGEEHSPLGTCTLLELENGKCVYTNSVLEFIVRPGSSVSAISPFPEQGIADITNAVEYLEGDEIKINSYCLIPRGNDGRGIKVNNELSYILVRGDYYIG